jgi:hypothetical protein
VGRDGERYAGDLRKNGTGIFLRRGLDSGWVICPSGATSRLERSITIALAAITSENVISAINHDHLLSL